MLALHYSRHVFIVCAMLTLIFQNGNGTNLKKSNTKKLPLFSNFSYQGDDAIYKSYSLKANEFHNPILQGCYPDPAICRKGDDFYMVCSSFAFFPGVPIFHSQDLVNWKQIGHVLDRESQLKVFDTGMSAGVYAPAIKYNPYNETFYMITTQFAGGFGNIVVKTKDPLKGWSDPYKLNFDGIDPSLFFDDNGKAYVVHNDAPARGQELYNGHRVIKVWEYDLQNDQVIAGTDKVIVNGGVDLSKRPIWIEAPHMYKKNGKYYLMCAEGGTGGNHSEVIFKSDNPKGPFIPAANNPILSQRHLPANRMNKVDWAGHADLVEGRDGKYYGVFLAIRPNDKDRVTTGRETFILPVDWTGEYPVFENGLIPMEPNLKMPVGVVNQTGRNGYFPNGNFTFNDNFTSTPLDFRWIGVRGPREKFVTTTEKGLLITPFETNIREVKPTSTLFHRFQHKKFNSSVVLSYIPKSDSELAGIVCYQKENYNYVFGITKKDKEYYILLERNEGQKSTVISSAKIELKKPIKLAIECNGDNIRFNYSENELDYVNLGGTLSTDIITTNVAGGFTGTLLGLYATTKNDIKL